MRQLLAIVFIYLGFATLSLSGQVTFTSQNQSVDCAAGTFCVDVDVTNFRQINGMQFALQWNTSLFDYSSHTFSALAGVPIDLVDASAGYMAFSWFGPFTGQTIADGTTIITLCLDLLGNAGSVSDIEFVPQPGQLIEVSDVPNGPLDVTTQVVFNEAQITITDTQNPVITCPSDTSSFSSIVNNIDPASITDDCAIDVVTFSLGGATTGAGTNDASGTAFMDGVTTITYTAQDFGGNTNSCSFNLTVMDTTTIDPDILYFDPQISVDCATDIVTVDVNVINFDSMFSMQFGIFWDTAVVSYLNHTNINLNPPGDPFITTITDDGVLVLLWTLTPPVPEGLTLADNSTIFQIQFMRKQSFGLP
ncbi:MAG: HYR domain-containing protein, partial [Bacteroidota bacterium]